ACTHTHYFALLLAAIIGFTGIFFLTKANAKKYFLSGALIFILFIPEISIFRYQVSVGGLSDWLGKPDENFFRSFINFAFNDSNFLFYLFIGTMITSFIYFRRTLV